MRYNHYDKFKMHSTFRLTEGRLYKVDVKPSLNIMFRLLDDEDRYISLSEGDYIMCVAKPKKVVYGDVDNGFTQYWRCSFLTKDKVGHLVFLRSPMDLTRFNYLANLRLLQVA